MTLAIYLAASGNTPINVGINAQAGMVMVNKGANIWVPYDSSAPSTYPGAQIGVCLSTFVPPGNQISVQLSGIVPYEIYNIGAGSAGIVYATFSSKVTRTPNNQSIGTCDPSGALTISPSYVGQPFGFVTSGTLPLVAAPTFVSNLVNITPGASQTAVICSGYSAQNDGGGGVFIWNPSDNRASPAGSTGVVAGSDGGTYFPGNAMATGRWNRVLERIKFNVLWFGADYLGNVDSTAAFTNCLASAPGEWEIPDGTYIITGLTINKETRIHLGATTVTGTAANALFTVNHNLTMVGQSEFATNLVPFSGQTAISWSGAWPAPGDLFTQTFYLEHIGFQGGLHHIDTTGVPIFSQGSFTLKHLRCYNSSDYAIIIKDDVSYTQVEHIGFTNCNGSMNIGAATETKIRLCVHNPANNSTNPTINLDSSHRVFIQEDQFENAVGRTAPDILIFASDANSQASGIVKIKECNFGPEREYQYNASRYRILAYNSGNQIDAIGPVSIEDCYFYAGGSSTVTINTITVAAGVATASLILVAGTDCGMQIGDQFTIIDSNDSHINGGPYTITGKPDGTHIQWAVTSGASTTGGLIFTNSVSAIGLKSPPMFWHIDGNFFNNFGFAIDDSNILPIDPNSRNAIGKCVWGSGNRIFGPAGRGPGYVFKNGGQCFDRADIPLSVGDAPLVGTPKNTETLQLLNRMFYSEQTSGVVGSCTVTTGLTDPYGGTGAFRVARGGATQMFHAGSGPLECAVTEFDAGHTYTLPTAPPLLYLTFWAMQDTSPKTNMATFLIYQGAAQAPFNTVWWMQTVTLGTTWKKYILPIPWIPAFGFTGGGTGLNDLYFGPGAEDPEVSSALFSRIQISDVYDSDYLPALSNAPVQDTTTGTRLSKGLNISAAGLTGLTVTNGVNTSSKYVTMIIDGVAQKVLLA